MKLGHKITSGYLLIAILTSLVAIFGVRVSQEIEAAYRSVRSETLPVNQVLQRIKTAGHMVLSETKGVLLRSQLPQDGETGGTMVELVGADSPLTAARIDLQQTTDSYRLLVEEHFAEEVDSMAGIVAAVTELVEMHDSLLSLLAEEGIPKLLERMDDVDVRLDRRIDAALKNESDELNERSDYIDELIQRLELITIFGLGVLFTFALASGTLVNRAVTRPVGQLIGAARKIGVGDWSYKLEINSNDELGQLAKTFNSMAVEIASSQLALQEMYAYSDGILRAMTNALIIVGSDGLVIRGNEALDKLTGRRAADLEGMQIEKILALDWQQLAAGENFSGVSLEALALHKDGHEIPVMLSVAGLCHEEQHAREFICVAQDISVMKQAEEDRAASGRFLDSVLNSLRDEICIIDAHSRRLIGCNQSFAKAHQVDRNNLGVATCHQVSHGQPEACSGAAHPCPLDKVLVSGKLESCDHIHTGADGSPQFYDIQCCPVVDADGEIVQIVHVSRNITEQKFAEKTLEAFNLEMEANNQVLVQQTMELEEAHAELKASQSRILQQEKMASIGQLAAGVAHEINNPMGFIISNLRSLRKYSERLMDYLEQQQAWIVGASADGKLPGELAASRKQLKIDYLCDDLPELLEESLGGADRVKQIVQDLKSFSRVDQQEFKQIDLNDCLETTINMVWNELKYKVELVRDLAELPPVACYPQQLNQVFMNILINAAQAIESSGEIVVRTRSEGEKVTIAISDNGCGIPLEVQHRIFEPFFTTKAVGQGTGLGMSIVFDIIKKHHGEILLDSTPGKGTTFTIVLPIDLAEPEADAEAKAAAEPAVAAGAEKTTSPYPAEETAAAPGWPS